MQAIRDIVEGLTVSGTAPKEAAPRATGRQIAPVTLGQLDTSNPIMGGAVEMVYRWRDRKLDGYDDASIVLCGPVGTGKTHIARAVLWSIALVSEGQPIAPAGKFFLAADLLLKFSPVKTQWGGSEMPRAGDVIGQAPIVVIDDIGAEGNIPFVAAEDQEHERQARYFRAIDYCYTWKISLVLTSNLSIKQLESHLGPRSWDRLCQMAPRGFMYDLANVPSWRQKESGR